MIELVEVRQGGVAVIRYQQKGLTMQNGYEPKLVEYLAARHKSKTAEEFDKAIKEAAAREAARKEKALQDRERRRDRRAYGIISFVILIITLLAVYGEVYGQTAQIDTVLHLDDYGAWKEERTTYSDADIKLNILDELNEYSPGDYILLEVPPRVERHRDRS